MVTYKGQNVYIRDLSEDKQYLVRSDESEDVLGPMPKSEIAGAMNDQGWGSSITIIEDALQSGLEAAASGDTA